MDFSFTVPTLELGVERSGMERLAQAVRTLPDQGYALLRSAGSEYRAVSKPELGELVVKMSSPADRLSFIDADPICLVAQQDEIEERFLRLVPPRGRVIAVRPSGLAVAHEARLELAHEVALASSLAGFEVVPMTVSDVGLSQPTGVSLPTLDLVLCPLLPPTGRPPGQPFLERGHRFVHYFGFSVCSRDGAECRHEGHHRIPVPNNPLRTQCGRCGSRRL
ncbi:MAG TPA: hypothetical protein VN783_04465 [Thermoanaerobaculia bacterium]|nr:hypothetical protein [Thermoanaerobaculia bacterium]